MSMNEVFPPNGPHNKMSLPVTTHTSAPLVSGSPVMVGGLIGVAQTAIHTDDASLDVINSNAPGHVTVWSAGTWRLSTYVQTSKGGVGTPVYAKVINAGSSVVALTTDAADATGVGKTTTLFGHIYEPVVGGNAAQDVAVRVLDVAGPTITNP